MISVGATLVVALLWLKISYGVYNKVLVKKIEMRMSRMDEFCEWF